MTVHDAIPKARGLPVSFTSLCQNPAPAGVLLSESVTRMNDCPRRYTKNARRSGQLALFNHLRILQRRYRRILHLMNLADNRGDAAVA